MSLSTSSSELWRRFFRLIAGSAAITAGIVYVFVVLVDPFDTLPLSPPLHRVPVAGNQRFGYPALARSDRFDSAIFGTSSIRLLKPAVLNPLLSARFANLAMNDATVYEQARLLGVFARAHPHPKVVILGLDIRWCVTGPDYDRLTFRAFPEWMYDDNRWKGYGEMLNLYAIQSAGQLFGVLIGVKAPDQGLDGYTSFVPPDQTYDPARALLHLKDATPYVPSGPRPSEPAAMVFPALGPLHAMLSGLPAATRKIVLFVPYHVRIQPEPGSVGAAVWSECKRRVLAEVQSIPNGLVVDFMRSTPMTTRDDNYWDSVHYRVGVADQIAHDLVDAIAGKPGDDYVILGP